MKSKWAAEKTQKLQIQRLLKEKEKQMSLKLSEEIQKQNVLQKQLQKEQEMKQQEQVSKDIQLSLSASMESKKIIKEEKALRKRQSIMTRNALREFQLKKAEELELAKKKAEKELLEAQKLDYQSN